jgi:hypothetical protein
METMLFLLLNHDFVTHIFFGERFIDQEEIDWNFYDWAKLKTWFNYFAELSGTLWLGDVNKICRFFRYLVYFSIEITVAF